jgi:hypothetical protein
MIWSQIVNLIFNFLKPSFDHSFELTQLQIKNTNPLPKIITPTSQLQMKKMQAHS